MSSYINLEPLSFKIAIENTDNAIVLDVRTPKEVAEGTIQNAMIIDYRMRDFTTQIRSLDKTKPYFVYCKAGNRSSKTCMLMKNSGFEHVTNLKGGWNAWESTFLTTTSSDVKPMIRIGDTAPDFEAIATTGKFQFSEYQQDSWIILFSHPADFTPVCTTELASFAQEQNYFLSQNTKLLGLSIDSIHSHLAWVNNIRERMNVSVQYPIIADSDMRIAKTYGMMHPNESSTSTVRALYFIDPSQKIRLILYYPVNIGRSIDEIKRVLAALQKSDSENCATPANWVQGEKAVLKAPQTIQEMNERVENKDNNDQVDFYLVKQDDN